MTSDHAVRELQAFNAERVVGSRNRTSGFASATPRLGPRDLRIRLLSGPPVMLPNTRIWVGRTAVAVAEKEVEALRAALPDKTRIEVCDASGKAVGVLVREGLERRTARDVRWRED